MQKTPSISRKCEWKIAGSSQCHTVWVQKSCKPWPWWCKGDPGWDNACEQLRAEPAGHWGMRQSVPSLKTRTAVLNLFLIIFPELPKLFWWQRLPKYSTPSTTDPWGGRLFPTGNGSCQNTVVWFFFARLHEDFSLHLPPNTVCCEHPCCSSWNLSCWRTNPNVVFFSCMCKTGCACSSRTVRTPAF